MANQPLNDVSCADVTCLCDHLRRRLFMFISLQVSHSSKTPHTYQLIMGMPFCKPVTLEYQMNHV